MGELPLDHLLVSSPNLLIVQILVIIKTVVEKGKIYDFKEFIFILIYIYNILIARLINNEEVIKTGMNLENLIFPNSKIITIKLLVIVILKAVVVAVVIVIVAYLIKMKIVLKILIMMI